MSATETSVPTVSNAITIAEDVLTRTAEVVKKLSPETGGRVSDDLEVFTVENSVILRKQASVDSSDIEIFVHEEPRAEVAMGGFFTESFTRTFKNDEGKAFVDTIIHVHLAPENSGIEVNTAGIERSLQVLCEGYVRSLEVLYAPRSARI